jgi:hypothetical protein
MSMRMTVKTSLLVGAGILVGTILSVAVGAQAKIHPSFTSGANPSLVMEVGDLVRVSCRQPVVDEAARRSKAYVYLNAGTLSCITSK